MSFIYHGFKSWNIQAAQEARVLSGKDKQFKLSMNAEQRLEAAIVEQGYQPYMNKRVYSEKLNHRREIDAIVVTDQTILVVEIKNWQGNVWRRGIRWYQQAAPNARALEFEDLVIENNKKADVLREFLERQPGICTKNGGALREGQPGLPDKAFTSVVVFMNPKVRLDPATLADKESREKDHIFTLDTFSEWLKNSGFKSSNFMTGRGAGSGAGSGWARAWSDTLWSYVPMMAPKDPLLTKEVIGACCRALDDVKTWDTLFLHNGTMVTGDITKIVVPNKKISLDRADIQYCRMEWAANTVFGCVASMYNGSAGFLIVQLKPKKGLDSSRLTLRIPVQMGYAKDKSRVDHLEIKLAGKRYGEIHPLQYVKGIAYGAGGAGSTAASSALSQDPTAAANKKWI